jgi:hypothetical protein
VAAVSASPIRYQLVDALAGSITVESAVGVGAALHHPPPRLGLKRPSPGWTRPDS